MIMALLLAAIAGWAAHLLRVPTQRWFPTDGLNRLASYAEGGMVVIVMYTIMVWNDLDGEARKRAITALILTFFGVGAGTVAGWLLDVERGGDGR
jgi:hypothetical protein